MEIFGDNNLFRGSEDLEKVILIRKAWKYLDMIMFSEL